MHIKLITDWDTIWSNDFQKEWLNWIEEAEDFNIFFHPAFVKVWVKTYLPIRDISPIFCIASDELGNKIFMPLILWKKNWKSAFEKIIIPIGYSDYDYNYPIVNGQSKAINWNDFWNKLIDTLEHDFSFDKIEITGQKEDNCPSSNNLECIVDDVCPLICVEEFENYDTFMATLKSKERSDIRRQEKRLRELGEFEYKIYDINEIEEASKSIQIMLEHHSLRWPNAYKAPNFHNNLLDSLLNQGFIHFSEIIIDGKTISWNLSFQFNGVYYFYMPTYVEKFKTYSPGKINMFLALQDCFNNKFRVFDMLKGAEDYKRKIPTKDIQVYKIKFYNTKLSTKIKRLALDVRTKIKN